MSMIGSVSLYDDDDDKCVEVVRALDSRCQVPRVATVHGRKSSAEHTSNLILMVEGKVRIKCDKQTDRCKM